MGFNKNIEKLFSSKNNNKKKNQKHKQQQKNKTTKKKKKFVDLGESFSSSDSFNGATGENKSCCSSLTDDDEASIRSLIYDCVSTTSYDKPSTLVQKITGSIEKDQYTRLYCISRGELPKPRDTILTSFSVVEQSLKGLVVSKSSERCEPSPGYVDNKTVLENNGKKTANDKGITATVGDVNNKTMLENNGKKTANDKGITATVRDADTKTMVENKGIKTADDKGITATVRDSDNKAMLENKSIKTANNKGITATVRDADTKTMVENIYIGTGDDSNSITSINSDRTVEDYDGISRSFYDDGISRSSSIIDFDEVVFDEKLPWTPIPVRALPKIFGFDVNGNEIVEKVLSKITYAFGSIYEPEKQIIEKLYTYRNTKVNALKFAEINVQTVNIPLRASSTETHEDYERHLKHMRQIDQKPNGPVPEPRIRRNIMEGSYPNYSVQEDKLPRLLRYVWKGKLQRIKKYLANKSKHHKVNREDNRGRTALHYAASWNCGRTMQLLLDVPGIKINTRDEHGKTPLYKAVEIKSMDCVKMLLGAGANVKISARDSRNPFEYAIQEIGDECFRLIHYLYNQTELKDETTKDGKLTYIHKMCLGKPVHVTRTIQMFLQNGIAVDRVEGKGRTPLILATMKDRPDIVRVLLRNGANILHRDDLLKDVFCYTHSTSDCYDMLKDNQMVRRRRKVVVAPSPAPLTDYHQPQSCNSTIGMGSSSLPASSEKYKN